jgi:hypothetical protein
MHAHRCKECTLLRCDGPNAVCSECISRMVTVKVSKIEKAYQDLLKSPLPVIHVTNSGMMPYYGGGGPAQTTGPAPPQPMPMPQCTWKHSAKGAAKHLMAVYWGDLIIHAQKLGITITSKDISALHAILDSYAASP